MTLCIPIYDGYQNLAPKRHSLHTYTTALRVSRATTDLTDFPDALNSTSLHGQKEHGGRVRHGSGVARVSEQVKPKYMI